MREIGGSRGLDAAYFARFQREILLFVLGDPAGLDPVRASVEARIDTLLREGLVESRVPAAYVPEVERYGGEEGLRLAGSVFQADSIACLDLLEAEHRGSLGKPRRECSLVLTERLLDLAGCDRRRKIEFYRYAYAWAIEQGRWQQPELELLEERYRGLREGLAALFGGRDPGDDAAVFGGEEPARIARNWIDATRPLIAALLRARDEARVTADLVPLLWSFAHMQCNRLGITGDAEAILRFFMQRYHEDAGGESA